MTQYGPVGHFPVKDKIVCITGGGSGIGLAFAQECHRKGARVLIGDLRLTKEGEDFYSRTHRAEVVFKTCNVTSWKDLHDLISSSVEAFGEVPDVYAPIAGIYEPPSSNFWDDTEDEGYKTIRINVEHPIKFTRMAMRALAGAQKHGVVCLVSSGVALFPSYLSSLYASSKFAVYGFARAMGQADVEEGVRVVCMLPGLVRTPLLSDREDNFSQWANFETTEALLPSAIAEVMLRMVEDGEKYDGGTCVLKTPTEETVVNDGAATLAKKNPTRTVAASALADLTRSKSAIGQERGVRWI